MPYDNVINYMYGCNTIIILFNLSFLAAEAKRETTLSSIYSFLLASFASSLFPS